MQTAEWLVLRVRKFAGFCGFCSTDSEDEKKPNQEKEKVKIKIGGVDGKPNGVW